MFPMTDEQCKRWLAVMLRPTPPITVGKVLVVGEDGIPRVKEAGHDDPRS